jgi:hypothetical protein
MLQSTYISPYFQNCVFKNEIFFPKLSPLDYLQVTINMIQN